MKKSGIKIVKDGRDAFLSVTAQDSGNVSHPLLIRFDKEKQVMTFNCRGGCALEIDKEQVAVLLSFIAEINS